VVEPVRQSITAPGEPFFKGFLLKHATPVCAAAAFAVIVWALVFFGTRALFILAGPDAPIPPMLDCSGPQYCRIAIYPVYGTCMAVLMAAMVVMTRGMNLPLRALLMPVAPLYPLLTSALWEGLSGLQFDAPSGPPGRARRAKLVGAGLGASALLHASAFALAALVALLSLGAWRQPAFGWGGASLSCVTDVIGFFLLGTAETCRPDSKTWEIAQALAVFIVVLGCSFVIDVVLGLHAAVSIRRTVAQLTASGLVTPGDAPPTPADARIVHVSDLHVVSDASSYRCESPDTGPAGNGLIETRLAELVPTFDRATAVVLSGDLTDAGSHLEWMEFLRVLESLPPSVRSRLFIVPGNHDLNLVVPERRLFKQSDTEDLLGRRLRSMLFTLVVSRIQADRCRVARVTPQGDVSWQPMLDVLGPHLPKIRQALGKLEQGHQPEEIGFFDLTVLFPYVWDIETSSGRRVALIGINTCDVGASLATNAIGQFPVGKLRHVVSSLVKEGAMPILVGHHHILPLFEIDGATTRTGRARTLYARAKATASLALMAAKDGEAAFQMLMRIASAKGFAYLHGHRHVSRAFESRTGGGANCQVMGAPSLLFGDEFTGDPSSVAMIHELLADDPGAGAVPIQPARIRTAIVRTLHPFVAIGSSSSTPL